MIIKSYLKLFLSYLAIQDNSIRARKMQKKNMSHKKSVSIEMTLLFILRENMGHINYFVPAIVALITAVANSTFLEGSEIGCFVPLECTESVAVGLSVQDSPKDCFGFCQEVADCNFFTHYDTDNTCIAYANCNQVNENCTDCISGNSNISQVSICCLFIF